MRAWLYHVVTALLLSLLAPALVRAAPFVNLNFEQATVPPGTSPGFLPAAQAYPGWTPRIGDIPLGFVHYNTLGIGEGAVALYDTSPSGGFHVIEGSFSVGLLTDFALNLPASLSQTGDVPSGTRSLRLLASISILPPRVFVDDIELPLVRLSDPIGPPGGAHYIWGADATHLGGRMDVQLRLASNFLGQPDSAVSVDAISLSPIPIPEATGALGVLMITLMAIRAQRPHDDSRHSKYPGQGVIYGDARKTSTGETRT